MSKATIEDKTLVLERLEATNESVIDFVDYDQLLVVLGLDYVDDPSRKWSMSRFKRTLGSLQHTSGLLTVHRVGEPTCSGEYRPYRLVRNAKSRSESVAHVDGASV